MGFTNFPNGVTSFGMPILPGGVPPTTGNIFFVDSGAVPNGAGTLQKPDLTIDTAVGRCTASNGDIIIVMPGHEDALTAATSLVLDVVGIRIIGLGHGNVRPKLDFDNDLATVEFDAADVQMENIVLRASVGAISGSVNFDANRSVLKHCKTTWEATGDDLPIDQEA